MGTNRDKRARQQANRHAGAEPGGKVGRAVITIVLVALVGVIGVVIWQFGSGGDEIDEPTAETTPSVATDAADVTRTPCPPTEGAAQRRGTFEGPPEMCIDSAKVYSAKVYSAKVDTTVGAFTISLDARAAPQTVNNFVVLARYRYYDGVPFHRVVPGFVIQAGDGDGTADGSNDLGYVIPDELPDSAEQYVDYSVAMANRGPGTGASQFFVVLPGGGDQLTPAYSLFGQVTDGTEVVDAIGALGGGDQTPTSEVLIESVSITETPG